MTDPAILFVRPQAISPEDKESLKEAGVLVIEIDDPANAKFVRAAVELNGTEMLAVAAKAIKHSDAATKEFGKLMCIALQATHT